MKLILVFGAAVLAMRYLPTGIALLNLEFEFSFFRVEKIEASRIQAVVGMRAKNGSSKSIFMQHMNGKITMNNALLGYYELALNTGIPAKGSNVIPVRFSIDYKTVGEKLWNMILTRNTEFVFNIKGPVYANDMTFPLNATWTTKDLIEEFTTIGSVKRQTSNVKR